MKGLPSDSILCLLVADSTVGGLVPLLAASTEVPSVRCTVAPFDQVIPVLLDGTAPCWALRPEIAVVWTRPQAVIETFGRLLENERVPLDEILSEVDRFVERLQSAARRVSTLFVPSWTLPGFDRGLGLLNMNPDVGPAYALLRMNARLAEGLAAAGNGYVLDASRWMAMAGPAAANPKLWHLGKIAFGHDVFKLAASDIKAGLRALRGQSRKLIVLDLDDTLWGGVVGDLGWENVKLGGHDPIGEAYSAFQRALRALTRRGIVLGIVSKNTESVALEVFDKHPEMVLRRDHFVAFRINWGDKAGNLVELAKELNLGLESVVFIDDNPVERARVREALPQVLVPEWPADRLMYEKALSELTCFDAAAISEEDRARTAMYVSHRGRAESQGPGQSLEDHLASLGIRVVCEQLRPASLQRAVQLLNKTNQMNLTTRRFAEHEFRDWAEAEENSVLVFRVTDRFGDYGLTGLATLTMAGTTADVSDFVLSCRVLGRGVEEAILHCLGERARELGADRLQATYRPTARNAPCGEFFRTRSGFASEGASGRFAWSLDRPYPFPNHIDLGTLEPEGQPVRDR